MIEYRLENSKDGNDSAIRLKSLRGYWGNLCPEFQKWFVNKRKTTF